MAFIERGTAVYDYALKAAERRQRLLNPANAVKDDGIDLRRQRARPITKEERKAEELAAQIKEEVAKTPPLPLKKEEKPAAKLPPHATILEIKRAVSEHYNVPIGELDAPNRRVDVAYARHVAVFLARTQTKKAWGELARLFFRDHTTLIHSYYTIKAKVDAAEPVIWREINEIWASLNAYRAHYCSVSPIRQPHLALYLERPAASLPGPEIRLMAEAMPAGVVGPEAEGVQHDMFAGEGGGGAAPAGQAETGFGQQLESLTGLSSGGTDCGQ